MKHFEENFSKHGALVMDSFQVSLMKSKTFLSPGEHRWSIGGHIGCHCLDASLPSLLRVFETRYCFRIGHHCSNKCPELCSCVCGGMVSGEKSRRASQWMLPRGYHPVERF